MEPLQNNIVTGNCISVMNSMDEFSVDIILTSPPYNVGLNYDGFDDNITDEEHRNFSYEWLVEAFRVLSDGGRMYVIVSDNMIYWFREVAEKAGFKYVQKLVWCKPNFVGMAGKITNDWNYMTEDILLFRKGKRTAMLRGSGTTHNYFVVPTPQSNWTGGRIHPAQIPVNLCVKILDRTPGNIVLDPFAGSGSVLVAAKILWRNYIGIELVDSVAERARIRLDKTQAPMITQEYLQSQMFEAL